MTTRANIRLAKSLLVVMTLVVVVVEAPDLTHHLHHQQQQPQHELHHPGSMLPHDDASWQTGYRCGDVCELRQSVQRLSAAQLDYAQALQAVYGLVDTVRRQFVAAR